MLSHSIFLGLLATAVAMKPSVNITQTVISNAYIVQLKNDSALTSSFLARSLDAHAQFHKRAEDISYDVRTEFKSPDLFYGLSITITEDLSADEVKAKVLEIPDVEAIWPIHVVMAPSPYGSAKNDSSSKRAKSTPSETVPGDASTLLHITGDLDLLSTHKMTDVDKVHALGIKGKGVQIAILDTGVDYRHPSLGGGFGPGFKIEGGYAFVPDYWTGDAVETPDPLATCFDGGHGTHVTGIIGMEDPKGVGFGLLGVAPEATIYMYRIFTCDGYTTDEIILLAMQRAVDDGASLLSMSFGETSFLQNSDDGADPIAQMTSGLATRGVASIVAAGNDGAAGVYYTSSPAIGPEAISVGSIANTKYPLTYSATDSRGRDFKYASVWPILSKEPLDVYVLRCDGTGYGCSLFGFEEAIATIDVNSTVLALAGSACADGYINWQYYGFKYVALLSDRDELFDSDYWLFERVDADQELFINIDASDSKTLLSMYDKAGGYGKYKWTFGNQEAKSIKQTITGGMMSNYSTFGPPIDTLNLKPQISAPGGNVLSTWPLGYLGGYTIISGTSMATPFLAGCYALVKSKFPELSIAEIKALLQSTATPVPWVPDTSILSSAVHQGAGLVNPYKAITFESSIFPGELSVGDTADFGDAPKNITITNKSSRSKTYIISHQGAGLVQRFPYPDLLLPSAWYQYGTPQYATYGSASLSTNQVLLGAGQSVDIEVTFSAPSGVDPAKNPILSGFIKITNNNDHFSIPYAGVPYDRFNAEYFDQTNNTYQSTFGGISPWDTFNFDYSPTAIKDTSVLEFDWTNYLYPQIAASFNFFSKMIRMDILPPDTNYVPDKYGFNTAEIVEYKFSKSNLTSKFLGYDTFGQAWNHTDQIPQSGWKFWYWRTVLTDDGESLQVGNGDYRILLSILRYGGDPANRESWESFLSPVVRYINVMD